MTKVKYTKNRKFFDFYAYSYNAREYIRGEVEEKRTEKLVSRRTRETARKQLSRRSVLGVKCHEKGPSPEGSHRVCDERSG